MGPFTSNHRRQLLAISFIASVLSLAGVAAILYFNWAVISADYMEIPGCLLKSWKFLVVNSLVIPAGALVLAWLVVLDNETPFSFVCFVMSIATMVLPLVVLISPVVIMVLAFFYAFFFPI